MENKTRTNFLGQGPWLGRWFADYLFWLRLRLRLRRRRRRFALVIVLFRVASGPSCVEAASVGEDQTESQDIISALRISKPSVAIEEHAAFNLKGLYWEVPKPHSDPVGMPVSANHDMVCFCQAFLWGRVGVDWHFRRVHRVREASSHLRH